MRAKHCIKSFCFIPSNVRSVSTPVAGRRAPLLHATAAAAAVDLASSAGKRCRWGAGAAATLAALGLVLRACWS